MDERRSYWGWSASSALHGALLALILLGFASAPKFEDIPESIAVETVTQSELNQIMNGEKDAKPAPQPPPAPAPPTPPEAPPDLRASEEPSPSPPPRPEPAPPPKPEPPSPPPKPAAQPKPAQPPPPKPAAEDAPEPPSRPKTVETPPERPKEPAEKPRPDPIVKTAERDRTETEPKPTHAYDPSAIAKLIGQTKPSASSSASNATGATPQGLPHHDAPRMSLSMASALDAWLTQRYLDCWTPPPTMPEGDVYVAQVKVVFNADGSLSGRPILINPPTDSAWRAHAESAIRAVKKCDPLHVPPQYAPYFDQWKIETIHFDPRETPG